MRVALAALACPRSELRAALQTSLLETLGPQEPHRGWAQQWVMVPESRLSSWTYDTGLISTQRQDDKGLAAPSPDVAPCILPLQKLPVGRDWLLAPAGSVTSSTSVGSSVGPGYGGRYPLNLFHRTSAL